VVNVSGVTIDADHSAVEVGIENSFAAVAGEVVTVPVTPVTPVAQAVAVAPAFTG
jgi:hypothetical protein